MIPLGSLYYIYYKFHLPIYKKLTEAASYVGQVSTKSINLTIHYLDMNLFHRVSRSELSPEDLYILNAGHLITASLSIYLIYNIPYQPIIKYIKLGFESFPDRFVRVSNKNLDRLQLRHEVIYMFKRQTLPANTRMNFKKDVFEMRDYTLPICLRRNKKVIKIYKDDPYYYSPDIPRDLKHLCAYIDKKRYFNGYHLPHTEYNKGHFVSSYIQTARNTPEPKDYITSVSQVYMPLKNNLNSMTFEGKIELQKTIIRSMHVNIKSYCMTNSPSIISYVMDNNNLEEIIKLFTF